ncbi:MAG: DUF2169 domain-containing protein [Deltaproteobacteria bacterium]|nr:DUF2169 domain-containing protein [Deltaproteobacteria bacterium]
MRFRPPIVSRRIARSITARDVMPFAVGLVPWSVAERRTSVVVKARYAALERAILAEHPPRLGRGSASERRGSSSIERAAPDDFVTAKLGTDVLLSGSAYAARASSRIDARVRVAEVLDLAFTVVGPSPIERMPLAAEYLRGPDGVSPLPPVGPIRARDVERPPDEFDALEPAEQADAMAALFEWLAASQSRAEGDDRLAANAPASSDPRGAAQSKLPTRDALPLVTPLLDVGVSSAAAQLVTADFLRGDEVLELHGLTPGGGVRALALPGHRPIVFVAGAAGRYFLEMVLDTLQLDDEGITLTWRGQAPEDLFATPSVRLAVSLAELEVSPSRAAVESDLVRARHARAEVPEDGEIPDPPSPDVELLVEQALANEARRDANARGEAT